MSQVTEQSVRFQTALASIKLIQASAVLDLTEDDFDFLTRDRKSGSAGMPRPISYAVFCLKKKSQLVAYITDERCPRVEQGWMVAYRWQVLNFQPERGRGRA